jgi:predicted lactoylglutathione lyase
MDQRISLVTLGVNDLASARAFYEALGWSGAQQPDDEVCFFQAGGMVFGLWTALGGQWGGTSGAFADPEGYVWEVAHNPGWTLSDDGTVHI